MNPIRWLPHIHARVYGPPLLIPLARLEPLLDGLRAAMLQRGSSESPPVLADPASPESGHGEERPRGYRIARGVATLPIRGVLASRIGEIAPDSTPLQSYENLSSVLRSAHQDSRVRGILLDIDSPGGEAAGVFDLADEIRAAGQTKPIWALAHHNALSAAYTLAAAADRIWTTRSGNIGSLGVIALHADQSEFDAHEGVRYTYIYRGERKIDGNPHAALSPAAHATIQQAVDEVYDQLIDQVARHRRIEPARLRATEARVYDAEQALDRGLADRIGTIGQARAALVQHIHARFASRGSGESPLAAGSSHITPRGRKPMTDTPPEARGFDDDPVAVAEDDNVIQLRVQAATTAERERNAAIAALCNRYGVSDMIPALQAEGMTVEAAGLRILERKANDDMRRQIVAADTTSLRPRPAIGSEIEAAAQARFAAQRRGTE